jgi:hypothetical protein
MKKMIDKNTCLVFILFLIVCQFKFVVHKHQNYLKNIKIKMVGDDIKYFI